jgi:hypothetical protein
MITRRCVLRKGGSEGSGDESEVLMRYDTRCKDTLALYWVCGLRWISAWAARNAVDV